MHHLIFTDTEQATYPVTFLVPVIKKDDILKAYITPHTLDTKDALVVDLHYSQTSKKTPMTEMRAYLEQEVIPVLKRAKTEYVMVCDAEYFKALTKLAKVEPYLGYACDTGYGDFKVIYLPNYRQMFYDPVKVTERIKQGMGALQRCMDGKYSDPGTNIIHFAEYPSTTKDIAAWLDKLVEMDVPLTMDIEGFDLKHNKCGLGSISFAWNKHEGIAFLIDYEEIEGATEAPYGRNVYNAGLRVLLKEFFIKLSKKQIYHNIAFDVYALIYQLFMKDILDTVGLLEGLEVMLKNWDCTKLVTYLATNSCAGNKLGLKDQAQEFAGNYAMDDADIKDITRIPKAKLLEYNLVDSLSTWFVHEKHHATMIQDQQEDIYTNIFQPATKDIIQMQLTGLPVNMQRVTEVRAVLEADSRSAMDRMQNNPLVQKFVYQLNEEWVVKRNNELKVKRVTLADAKETFNPNSNPQLQKLLYEVIGLPIIATTKSKQPAADGDTLKALKNHTKDIHVIGLLEALKDFKDVDKILTSFIPALEEAVLGSDGWHYLFGNFNLGGTVSGRLSSSKPK